MPFRMPDKPDEIVGTGFKIVTPGYFRTLGLRLVSGRLLDERDTAGSVPVVVVNESFVRRYLPNQDPIGNRILVERILPSRRGLGPQTAWEIVGVVVDEKASGLENPTDVGAYASFAQNPVVGLGLVARGIGDPAMLIKSIQGAVRRVNKPRCSIGRCPSPSSRPIRRSAGGCRRICWAGSRCSRCCWPARGSTACCPSSRRNARRNWDPCRARRVAGDLVRMVIRSGTMPVIAGIVLGLGGAMWLSRFMQAMLFQVSPIDAPSLIAVAALFLTVALAACFVPAWRASRVDPMTALRQE